MITTSKPEELGEKPVPLPLCPPHRILYTDLPGIQPRLLQVRPETNNQSHYKFLSKGKVKHSHYRPGQAQRVLMKLRFPDFATTAQDGGRLSALCTGRLYPQEILLVLISVRG